MKHILDFTKDEDRSYKYALCGFKHINYGSFVHSLNNSDAEGVCNECLHTVRSFGKINDEQAPLKERVANYLAWGGSNERRTLLNILYGEEIMSIENEEEFIRQFKRLLGDTEKTGFICHEGRERFYEQFPELTPDPETKPFTITLEFEVPAELESNWYMFGEELLSSMKNSDDIHGTYIARCFKNLPDNAVFKQFTLGGDIPQHVKETRIVR